jgi:hypothetical protein
MHAVAGLGRAGNQREFWNNGFVEDYGSKIRCWTQSSLCFYCIYTTRMGYVLSALCVLSVFAGDCGFKGWKLCLFAVLFLRILANEPCFLFFLVFQV